MILVNRSEEPDFFKKADLTAYQDVVRKFYQLSEKDKSQRKFSFDFKMLHSSDIKEKLNSIFNGKCAFCEINVSHTGIVNVDHFRPVNGALGFSKNDFSREHYWWFAYEWWNLFPVCHYCNQSKGNRFPVIGERGTRSQNWHQTEQRENYLLLNPCGAEDPGLHLTFLENGEVRSESPRGEATIDICGLNRNSLVSKRSLVAKILHRQASDLLSQKFSKLRVKAILLMPHEEFLQLRMQLLQKWLSHEDYYFNDEYKVGEIQNNLTKKLFKIEVPRLNAPNRRFSKIVIDPRKILQNKSLNNSYIFNSTALSGFTSQIIERVEIKNFKAIESLSINFLSNLDDKVSWKMLLGENGSGKTSVLQAITLALAGEERIKHLNLNPSEFIRRTSKSTTTNVNVYLAGQNQPINLAIDPEEGFRCTPKEPNIILYSYGAVRLLDDSNLNERQKDNYDTKIKNLFDPSTRIGGITEWLLTVDESIFNQVSTAFKDILSLDADGSFIRNGKEIIFKYASASVNLRMLSDGYQSLIALLGHLMKSLLQEWPSLEVAEGIVILDEIGLHMHPKWKMKIVSSLRLAFPRVQFICTTHDPLCLKGLGDKEVEVIERTSSGVAVRNELPSIEGLRVDQILQSEHFGLHSTIDPKLEMQFNEYYNLITKSKKTSDDKSKISELKTYINSASIIASTRRERIVLEYVDEYIANSKKLRTEREALQLRVSTKNKIMKLLKARQGKND